MPVDASLSLVPLHFQGPDIPAERILVEEALFEATVGKDTEII